MLASISGNLYDDVNADGVKDIDEPSLQGWRVYLDENGNRSYDANEPSKITDANGHYLFDGLTAGSYDVRAEPQTGWTQTAPQNVTQVFDVDFEEQSFGPVQTTASSGALPLIKPTTRYLTQQSTANVAGTTGNLNTKHLLITGSSIDAAGSAVGGVGFQEATMRLSGLATFRWQGLVNELPVDDAHDATFYVNYINTNGFLSTSYYFTYGADGNLHYQNAGTAVASFNIGLADAFELTVDLDGGAYYLRINDQLVHQQTGASFGRGLVGMDFLSSVSSGSTGDAAPLAIDDFTYQWLDTQSPPAGHHVVVNASDEVPGNDFGFAPPALEFGSSSTTVSEDVETVSLSVSRPMAMAEPLVVSLSSSDLTELTVPATVTIPANETTVSFAVTGQPDYVIDGRQSVVVQANATGYQTASTMVTVQESRFAALPGSSSQRDVSLFYHDFEGQTSFPGEGPMTPYQRPELIPLLTSLFESQWDIYDVDVTTLNPGNSVDHVASALGEINADGVLGRAYGASCARTVCGSAFVDIGPEASWSNISSLTSSAYITSHELSHVAGLGHEYDHPLASVGSAIANQFIVGTTYPTGSTRQVTPRAVLDNALQAGRFVMELEPNDQADNAQDLSPFLAEMEGDASPRNDRVVVIGDIHSPDDVDQFTLSVTAGEKVAIDVDAAEFQIPLDAKLAIFDVNGELLAVNATAMDRETGITSVDPYLVHTFDESGTYRVEVSGTRGTFGSYRLKWTPDRAWDLDGPRVIGGTADGRSVSGTRQLLFYINEQVDPATLTAQNIRVTGNTSGMHTGVATFDPFHAAIVWRADSVLPVDMYTVQLKSGDTGIKDLRGNPLDGESDGTLNFPEISGDGSPGGDFVSTFSVSDNASAPTSLRSVSTHFPRQRGKVELNFYDSIDLLDVYDADLKVRGTGADSQFDTADDEFLPFDTYIDPIRQLGSSSVELHTRGFPVEANRFVDMIASITQDLVVEDFNRDGVNDLIAVSRAVGGQVLVALGQGLGEFAPTVHYRSIGSLPEDIATADLNGDGLLDLVFPLYGDDQVGIMLGESGGAFGDPTKVDVAEEPVAVVIADVDLDGRHDLLVAHQAGKAVRVIPGNGDGTFSASFDDYATRGTAFDLQYTDIDGDGIRDIVASDSSGLSLFLGSGGGAFGSLSTVTQNFLFDLAIGDVTSDGRPDVVLTDRILDRIQIWQGGGDGSFVAGNSFPVGNHPQGLALEDVNGDAKLDAIVANSSHGSVSVLFGDGLGSFATAATYQVGFQPRNLALSDVTGDGNRDIIVANRYSNGLIILPGRGDGTFENVRFRVEGQVVDAAGHEVPVSQEFAMPVTTRAPYVAELNVQPGTALTTPPNALHVTFSLPIDPNTLSPDSFAVRYSTDHEFFDGDDVILEDDDGAIDWDPSYRRATFRPATPFQSGYYMIQLDGDPSGITGTDGQLLDGEYQTSIIPGNHLLWNWNWAPSGDGNPGGDYRATFSIASPESNASVVARHLFYNNSSFDMNGDDGAVATDKLPLQSGTGAASIANYSSYHRGINGIMIDLAGRTGVEPLTSADFTFRVGNGSTWLPGPDPTSVTISYGTGAGGSDRIKLIWPDYSIVGQWLEVTLLDSARTELAAPDVFYFGNAVGETGNQTQQAFVDGFDFSGVRDHPSSAAAIDNRFDFSRDGIVDGTDLAIVRDNATDFVTALKLISLAPPPPSMNLILEQPQTRLQQRPRERVVLPLTYDGRSPASLPLGADGRNRAFLAVTARNHQSSATSSVVVTLEQDADDLNNDEIALRTLFARHTRAETRAARHFL